LLEPLAAGGLLLAATLVTRWVLARRWPVRVAQVVLGLLGLLAAVAVGAGAILATRPGLDWLAVPAELAGVPGWRASLAMIVTVLIWWRGLAAGRAPLMMDTVEAGFRRAVIALVVLFLGNQVAPPSLAVAGETLLGLALLALATGLMGLPLARIVEMREAASRREGPALPVSGSWLAMLGGTIGLLVLATLLLTAVLTFERTDVVLNILAVPLSILLWLAVILIALPLAILLDRLITFLRQFMQPAPPQEQPEAAPGLLEQLEALARGEALPPEYLTWLRLAFAIMLALVVVWLLGRAIFKFTEWRTSDEVEEEREFILSWAGLRAILARRLRALAGRRSRRAPAAPAGATPDLALDQGGSPRDLYRALLRLGARLGYRRNAAATPHEYERQLAKAPPLAGAQADLQRLTEVYIQARYGDTPPAPTAVVEARAALAELQTLADAAAATPDPTPRSAPPPDASALPPER
jgi:hypothetical protein